ncbi:extracellular solute-binding protein [Paenibacillus sp. NRS-1775]
MEQPVTLTMVRGEDPSAKFKNGESYADNVHTRWARDTLGVNLKTLWSAPLSDGTYDTKLKLMLSSGDQLPDVLVSTQNDTTSRFVESGKVLNVGKAFDQYASSTWKAAMKEVPSAWEPFMKDGEKYAIPIIRPTMGTQPVLWIRQDWLDKLHLKAPTNLEELEMVMDAFVNRDPDGNGKKDTLALDFGMKEQLSGYPIGNILWIFGLFGAIPERWYPDENGQLQYGSVQPGIKQALSKIKEWKNKGYIANDIALHDFNKVTEGIASGEVGMVGSESWFSEYPGSMTLANNPTARYTPYPLPKGENGENLRSVGVPYSGAILISKDISKEAMQAFFHYMNALYEVYETQDPLYFQAYQDGYDFKIQDGKVYFDNEHIPGGRVQTMKYSLIGSLLSFPSRDLETTLKMARGETLTNKDLVTSAFGGLVCNDTSNRTEETSSKAVLISMVQTDADVREYFQGPATATMKIRNAWLKKMQMDTFIEIIYGNRPLESFDAFVHKWRSSGGDEITEEVNEWYRSVQGIK